MKKVLIYLLFVFIYSGLLSAQTGGQILFQSPGKDGHPYRIPALTTLHNGDILAVADFRWCNADIGNGHVDIVGRISKDNGNSWGHEFTLARGSGIDGAHDCGYGDAAIVTDRETGRVLLMCCTGDVFYTFSSRGNPLRAARLYSDDNGMTWSQPEDITDEMYGLLPNVRALFLGSGRICQSRVTKVGSYYRLYAAVCTPSGNFALYSDDFGQNWQVLGSNTVSCAPDGNEPKCEELPDGSVILSSRKNGGRYFNIFKYSNPAAGQGKWTGVVSSNSIGGGLAFNNNATNGEIQLLQVVRQSDRTLRYMLLQSVPYGKINSGDAERSNVCIFYKVFDEKTMNSAEELAVGWIRGLTFENPYGAYSALCIQQDNRLGFLYETEPGEYSLVYRPITVEELTGNAYCLYNPDIHGNLDPDEQKLQAARREAEAVLETFAQRHAEVPALGQCPTTVYRHLQTEYEQATKENYERITQAIALLKESCNWPVFTINSENPDKGRGKSLADNGEGILTMGGTNNGNTLMLWKFEGLIATQMTVGDYVVTNLQTGLPLWETEFVNFGRTTPNTDGQFVIRTNGTDNPVFHENKWNFWPPGYKDFISKKDAYGANSGAAWSFTYVGNSYALERPVIEGRFREALAEAIGYKGMLGTTTGTYRDRNGTLQRALEEAESKEPAEFRTHELIALTLNLTEGLNALVLNLPEAGKFYRFRSKNTGLYITAGNMPGERPTLTDRAEDRETVFFLSSEGYLTGSNMLNLYSSWNAGEYGPYSRYAFSEANALGYYTIRPDALSYLYDNSAKNGTLDSWSDAKNEGCFWDIIEVTDPEQQPTLRKSLPTGYATVAAPVALQVPAGVKAYTVTVDKNKQTAGLEELADGIIPAGTGALLRSTDGRTKTELTFAARGTLTQNNDLQPVYRQKTVDSEVNAYILSNGSKGIGFYLLNANDRTLMDYKAYLVLPEGMKAVHSLKLEGTEETTGIEKQPEKDGNAEEVYYDLQGRRVTSPTRGIYITGKGKKVIFR